MEEQRAVKKHRDTYQSHSEHSGGLEMRKKRFGVMFLNSEENRAMGTEAERQVGRGHQGL